MKNTATLLKQSRIKAGLSQYDLGKRCKYGSGQIVSNCERGAAPIPYKILRELAKLVDADKLRCALDDDAFEANDKLIERVYRGKK